MEFIFIFTLLITIMFVTPLATMLFDLMAYFPFCVSHHQRKMSDMIIHSIQNNPEQWTVGQFNLSNGQIGVWIANRPHADCTIDGMRLGNRRELRKAIDMLKEHKLREQLDIKENE